MVRTYIYTQVPQVQHDPSILTGTSELFEGHIQEMKPSRT